MRCAWNLMWRDLVCRFQAFTVHTLVNVGARLIRRTYGLRDLVMYIYLFRPTGQCLSEMQEWKWFMEFINSFIFLYIALWVIANWSCSCRLISALGERTGEGDLQEVIRWGLLYIWYSACRTWSSELSETHIGKVIGSAIFLRCGWQWHVLYTPNFMK